MTYLLEVPKQAEAGFTVNDLVGIFRRRRVIFYSTVAVFLLLATIYCATSTRRYTATGIVQMQKDNQAGVDLTGIAGATDNPADALEMNVNMQTQANILGSDNLALKVAQDLHLENTQDFSPHFSLIGSLLGLFSTAPPPEPAALPLNDSPRRRAHVVKIFEKNLSVKVLSGTRLLEISYSNPDPKLAAEVVNHLVRGLMDYNFQTRLQATSETSAWLSGQLSDLRKQSEDQESKVADLQKQTGIYSLGANANGQEQLYSDVLDRLQKSTEQLSSATSNRILKEAVYRTARSGNADLISELSGTAVGTASPAVQTSLGLLQTLRLQQATLQSQLSQAEQKYGPAYPRIPELRGALSGIEQSVQAEVGRIGERSKNDYDVAKQMEDESKKIYEGNRSAANQLKDKAVDYSILREEANQSRTLYENLLAKLKEAGVVQGLKASNLAVVDAASPPDKPAKPNIPLYLAVALAAGVLFGGCGTLLVEAMDSRIQTVGELELLGAPLVGMLPHYGKNAWQLHSLSNAPAIEAPKSAYSEAMRAMRANLLVVKGPNVRRTVLITSAGPSEGKSLTAKSLAVSLAQQGKRVLLVQADLRRILPSRRSSSKLDLGVASEWGLSKLLADPELPCVPPPVKDVPNLWSLPAGSIPNNPAELLGSERMRSLVAQWKAEFDLVIIDSPPILPVVDALILAELVDHTILIAKHGATTRPSFNRAFRMLSMHTDPARIAVVLNDVKLESDAYSSYYGQHISNFYGEESNA
jgi:capsular exopolysaccharide synthesis family protein